MKLFVNQNFLGYKKMNIKNIDIFCEVIDNFGDAGVVFRLAKELKTYNNNFNVRIFINRLSELEKINKNRYFI